MKLGYVISLIGLAVVALSVTMAGVTNSILWSVPSFMGGLAVTLGIGSEIDW